MEKEENLKQENTTDETLNENNEADQKSDTGLTVMTRVYSY